VGVLGLLWGNRFPGRHEISRYWPFQGHLLHHLQDCELPTFIAVQKPVHNGWLRTFLSLLPTGFQLLVLAFMAMLGNVQSKAGLYTYSSTSTGAD